MRETNVGARNVRVPREPAIEALRGATGSADRTASSKVLGELDRCAPRFRIGPECATQAIARRRRRLLVDRCSGTAAQADFTAAAAQALDDLGKRTVCLP